MSKRLSQTSPSNAGSSLVTSGVATSGSSSSVRAALSAPDRGGETSPDREPVKPIKPKTGFNALVCLAFALLILFAGLLVIATLVAKTGLVRLPLVSRLYNGPTPSRSVTAGVYSPDEFYDKLSLKLATAVRRGEGPPYRVTVDEVELTAALRGALAGVIRGKSVIAERPQIVIMPQGVEFSGRFSQGSVTLDLLSRLRPIVKNGELALEPTLFELGDYTLPTSTAQSITGLLFSRDFGSWRLDVGQMSLTGIRLEDGKVELVLNPRAE